MGLAFSVDFKTFCSLFCWCTLFLFAGLVHKWLHMCSPHMILTVIATIVC